jgi:methanogenic corrinoid protein MtbC1
LHSDVRPIDATEALASVVVRDIVPRLLIDHRSRPATSHDRSRPAPFTAREETAFTKAVLAEPIETLRTTIDDYLLDGITAEQILLQLMTPVARRLGALWEADAIDLVDVTIGVQNMQVLVRHLQEREGESQVWRPRRRSQSRGAQTNAILLLPAPEEDHAFGLVVLGDVLRRRGFDVFGGLPVSRREMMTLVEARHYAVIGFSISCERHVLSLTRFITRVRTAVRATGTHILVGGQLVNKSPGLERRVGADQAFSDAVAAAEHIAAHVAQTPATPH